MSPDDSAGPLAVPVISVGRDSDDADLDAIAAVIDDACSTIGFFQATDHGIAPETISAMTDALDAFFDWPTADKAEFVPDDLSVNRGYAALGSEALAYSLGDETPPDWFEAFNIGPEPDPEHPVHRLNPHNFFSPNPWPDIPGFRSALLDYLDEATTLAHHITSLFARALKLAPDFFERHTDYATDTLRCIHYPPAPAAQSPLGSEMAMGAHSDYGIVTVLWADPIPGLQIVGPEGRWRAVMPDPGALLINLGDLLAQWTNDRWRSTLHRVVPPPPGQERRSVAFFHDGNYDSVVECLPSCASSDNPPRYAPVVAGEHLMAKLMAPRTMKPTEAQSTAGDRLWR